MYKLLLITDQPEVRQAFETIQNWENMGFRAPRMADSAAAAAEVLKKHHVDAFALALPKEEMAVLEPLLRKYPHTPIMTASADVEELCRNVDELSHLLNRTHADYSNDAYDLGEMMQMCRHDYFRTMLLGSERDRSAIRRRLSLLRSRMDPDKPCVLLALSHPDDDGYLALHWRYGADRLEVAMRNFFGAELSGMRILVSVLPDERLYLLACPMRFEENIPAENEMLAQVKTLVTRNIHDVQEYLNIELEMASVEVLPNIMSLADMEL